MSLRIKIILILLMGVFLICICCEKNEPLNTGAIDIIVDTLDVVEYDTVITIPVN
jgi:hypothetical protein